MSPLKLEVAQHLWTVNSFIYVFVYLEALGLSCVEQDLFIVMPGLSSPGSRALEGEDSVVLAHGLSCLAVCGILVP